MVVVTLGVVNAPDRELLSGNSDNESTVLETGEEGIAPPDVARTDFVKGDTSAIEMDKETPNVEADEISVGELVAIAEDVFDMVVLVGTEVVPGPEIVAVWIELPIEETLTLLSWPLALVTMVLLPEVVELAENLLVGAKDSVSALLLVELDDVLAAELSLMTLMLW